METVETQLAVLQRDVQVNNTLLNRLDTAIEKIGLLSNELTKMLAVHTEKLFMHDKTDEELYRLNEERRTELQTVVKEVKGEIMGAIEVVRQTINLGQEETAQKIRDMDRRLRAIERWRWVIIGGGLIVSGLLGVLLPVLARYMLGW